MSAAEAMGRVAESLGIDEEIHCLSGLWTASTQSEAHLANQALAPLGFSENTAFRRLALAIWPKLSPHPDPFGHSVWRSRLLGFD